MPDTDRPAREDDSIFMRRALDLAPLGWGQTAPNPMVGAVVVRGNEIVGEGFHARYGGSHAEIVALGAAGELARGSTLYVTLEPCTHHGNTPPCAAAVLEAGVSRVVIASRDANPAARGGVELLRQAGVDVVVGVLEADALELNAPFFHAFRSDRPWVVLKLAVSLEGAIADAARSRGWLTGPESRREVHRLRAGADAVGVGIGTVLADDPALTVRDGLTPRVPPVRVVFDSTARTPLESTLVSTARELPTVIVARVPNADRAAALRDRGVNVVTARTLGDGLRALTGLGVRSILVEGGAGIAGALMSAALVDRLIIFQAPVILGAGALNAFACAPGSRVNGAERLRVLERRPVGDDLMTVYALRAD